MQALLEFIRVNKPYVEIAQALSAFVNLIGWTLGAIFLIGAWRRNTIRSVTVGPLSFRMQDAAIEATAAAARDWKAKSPSQAIDLPRIKASVGRAFEPQTADRLVGKSILWVDDNPTNNLLAVRALRKLQLDVEQTESTEQALEQLKRRHFDLIISDMGRGAEMRAGYDLLARIRAQGLQLPFFIFAGSDRPEFRDEAKRLGAQLSTNDMIELIDNVVTYLGRD